MIVEYRLRGCLGLLVLVTNYPMITFQEFNLEVLMMLYHTSNCKTSQSLGLSRFAGLITANGWYSKKKKIVPKLLY
jgi:hypothetical protein